ncbi:hypothetical protein LCGC14_2929400, partial [marine sediment metagenome]
LKDGVSDQLKMRKVFDKACSDNGIVLSVSQQVAILTSFVQNAKTDGLLVEIPTEGNGKELQISSWASGSSCVHGSGPDK